MVSRTVSSLSVELTARLTSPRTCRPLRDTLGALRWHKAGEHAPMSDMIRRAFISLLGGAAAWPLPARAQKPIPPVGLLTSLSASMLSIKGGMDVTISANGSVLPERRTELVRYDDVQIEVVFEGNGPAVVLLPSLARDS